LEDALLGVLCECHSSGSGKPGEGGERGGSPAADAEAARQGDGDGGGGRGGTWMLGYAPPAVASKRGRWTVVEGEAAGGGAAAGTPAGGGAAAPPDAGVYEVLLPRDWYALAAYYGSGSQQGGGGARKRQRRQLDERLEALLERWVGWQAARGPCARLPPVPGAEGNRDARIALPSLESRTPSSAHAHQA
jgi:hypothetical protein